MRRSRDWIAMAAEDQPRFGARSPQWQDESQESTAPSSSSAVPWEQYGEVVAPVRTPRFARFDPSAEASSSSSSDDVAVPTAQESGDPSRRLPREGETGRIRLRTTGGPLGYAPPAQAPVDPSSVAAAPRVRKRGGWVVFLGIVMSVVCAPALFFAIAFSGTDFSAIQSSLREVSNGQSVTVDSSGGYVVQITAGSAQSCQLRGGDGGEHPMQVTLNQWTVSGLTPGEYTVSCSPDGVKMVGMTGFSESVALSKAPDAMTWSSVVGMLGLSVIGLGIYLRRSR